MENKTFIIAELSANHNHDFDLTKRTIKAMAESGADAVKIQTYTPDSLVMDIDNEYFGPISSGLWKGIKRYDLYKKGAMPYEWQPLLKKYAESLGLIFFSTPFDLDGVDFLETMNVPIYKIASFEINDIPLIRKVAKQHKPIIISTGVAGLDDIELAINTCKEEGCNDITLLKCTSEYPAPYEHINLLTIPDMAKRFNVRVGISDHTMGPFVSSAAVVLGATVVEKHFILSRSQGGPDSSFSMEPCEFKQMVNAIRIIEKSLGSVSYDLDDVKKGKRRALYATKDIQIGDFFSSDNIKSFRPSAGLSPKYYEELLGKKSTRYIKKGDPLTAEDI
ncbi:MAG: pseudaminic acid synthase [Candidatus Egerieousia sp.]